MITEGYSHDGDVPKLPIQNAEWSSFYWGKKISKHCNVSLESVYKNQR